MSDEQGPHPLDGIVKQLIDAVPDKNLRRWRGWLRGENEMGDELRRRFDESTFTEEQIEVLWKLIFHVADYQMHLLMGLHRVLGDGRADQDADLFQPGAVRRRPGRPRPADA